MFYAVLLEVKMVTVLQQQSLVWVWNYKLENIRRILDFIIWMKSF